MAQPQQLYVRHPSGEVQGPFVVAQLKLWAESGRIRPDMAFSPDRRTWTPGHLVRGLFPDAEALPEVPVSPPVTPKRVPPKRVPGARTPAGARRRDQ